MSLRKNLQVHIWSEIYLSIYKELLTLNNGNLIVSKAGLERCFYQ